MPDDAEPGNANPTLAGHKVNEPAPRPSRWASVLPTSVPAIIVAIVTVSSMWAMRSCDDTDELLRENMDLRFNLVDEKFNGLNESINQVRTELSEFKASYEERVRYLERERVEAANLTPDDDLDTVAIDEENTRVATTH